jgi:hypothetical protein
MHKPYSLLSRSAPAVRMASFKNDMSASCTQDDHFVVGGTANVQVRT